MTAGARFANYICGVLAGHYVAIRLTWSGASSAGRQFWESLPRKNSAGYRILRLSSSNQLVRSPANHMIPWSNGLNN